MFDHKLTDEAGRLAALKRYDIADHRGNDGFVRVTDLVRTILDVPICGVSLLNDKRQLFAAISGLNVAETARSVAFCDHAIRARTVFVIEDAHRDERFAASPLVTGDPFIRSYAGAPLVTHDGYNLGALCAIDRKPRQFTRQQTELLTRFAALVIDELELRTLAHEDYLTGLLTRRAFTDLALRSLRGALRGRGPTALLCLDVDRFKSINDRFGHDCGDRVLSAIAAECQSHLRPDELFGRLGGEEFVILLPNADARRAFECAERLRLAIGALAVAPVGSVTASFGIAIVDGPDDLSRALSRADEAMYEAKSSGRNRTVVAKQRALAA